MRRAATRRSWPTARRSPSRGTRRRSSRSRRPRRWSRWRPARTARTRSWPGWPSSSATRRARSPNTGASSRSDHTAVDAARRLAALAEKAGDEPAMHAGSRADRRARSVRRRGAHAASGGLRSSGKDATLAMREFKAALATGAADKAVGALRSRRSVPARRQAGRGEARSAGGARDRAELRAGAGPAAQVRRGQERPMIERGPATRPRALRSGPRCGRRRDCRCALALARSRAGARRPERPAARSALRRPAVDVRAHPLRRVDAAAGPSLRHLRRALDHRLPGRRAEPLAPRADRHVDPGQRSGRAHASKIPTSGPIPGSTSSSPATCG